MTTPTTAEQIEESPSVIGGAKAISPMPALSDLVSLAEDLAARHEAGGTEEEAHDAMVVRALAATIARLEGELSVLRPVVNRDMPVAAEHIGEILAENRALRTRADAAERERGSLRQRVEQAEKAARTTIEDCRRHGVSLGRALANHGYKMERERADAAERRVEAAATGLRAVEALIRESHGVVGLHLNGDIAVWEELRTGGRFEAWLLDFDTALAAASGAADGAATREG